jgi:hypothetical protein
MLFKNSVRTSKRTPHFTITKINWLTLFKKIVADCSDNQLEPINTKCRTNDYWSGWYISLPFRLIQQRHVMTGAINFPPDTRMSNNVSLKLQNNSFIHHSFIHLRVCPLYSGFPSPKTKFRHLSLSLVSSSVSPWFVMLRLTVFGSGPLYLSWGEDKEHLFLCFHLSSCCNSSIQY